MPADASPAPDASRASDPGPVEPPPTRWALSAPRDAPVGEAGDPPEGDDLVAIGADLEPGTVLAAYRAGLFPMGVGPDGAAPIGWWSPDPRGVLDPHALRVSRSLRRARRALDVTVDADFSAVVRACADPSRDGRWITPEVHDAYLVLHRLGWAHSVEVWRPGGRGPDDLVGGLYGLSLGGLFAGESMFHRATDASKVALVGLCEVLTKDRPDDAPRRLVDVQWLTPHLASLGAVEIGRGAYLAALPALLAQPGPPGFRSAARGQGLREPAATPPR